MDIITEVICVIPGFKLTECKTMVNNKVVKTHFNITDEAGKIKAQNFDDIESPLHLLICIDLKMQELIQQARERMPSLAAVSHPV